MNELNILIVEDELIIYMHITRTLKSLGFKNIHTARNSDEALRIASQTNINLLFSDIKIEGDVDGIETALILQNMYSLPVIFITAYKDREILERVSKVDIIGYLLKPYRVDELEALIYLAISKYDLTLENKLLEVGDNHTFDKKEKKLYFNNEEIYLSKKEKVFISMLIENINTYVSYKIIENIVWYDDLVTDSTRRTFYSRIRQKLNNLDFRTQRNNGIGIFKKV